MQRCEESLFANNFFLLDNWKLSKKQLFYLKDAAWVLLVVLDPVLGIFKFFCAMGAITRKIYIVVLESRTIWLSILNSHIYIVFVQYKLRKLKLCLYGRCYTYNMYWIAINFDAYVTRSVCMASVFTIFSIWGSLIKHWIRTRV